MTRFSAFLTALAACLSSCWSAEDSVPSTRRIPADISAEETSFELPRPDVEVQADPPPPFTYWAPEGSIIRNHGNPGVWVAYVDGVSRAMYFGDECRASEWQRYIGQPVSSVPAPAAGVEMRTTCATCAVTDDLRPNRVNVVFDETNQRIVSIACY